MKRIFLFAIILLFRCNGVFAATYYMATSGQNGAGVSGDLAHPWLTLQYSLSRISGGDTLIIRDGTYTGAANVMDSSHYPPIGSSSNYTTIKAEHDGGVIFDGQGVRYMCGIGVGSSGTTNVYWKFEGLIWCRAPDYESVCEFYHCGYVKLLRCGAYDAGSGNTVVFGFGSGCDRVLVENCYAWGKGRYMFLTGTTTHMIFRQCVARLDRVDAGSDPVAGFSIYSVDDAEIQNCIVIDCDQTQAWTSYQGLIGSFSVPSTSRNANRIIFSRCIAINNKLGGINTAGNTTYSSNDVTFRDCVVWNCANIDNDAINLIRGLRTQIINCTFGV